LNRDNFLSRNAAQLIFAACVVVALLLGFSRSSLAPLPSPTNQPLTVSSVDGRLGGFGRLFAYQPPTAPLICTATNATSCGQLALRDSGPSLVRDLIALMQVDYGGGKREQGNLILRFSQAEANTVLQNALAFTEGNLAPGSDQGRGGLALTGRYLYTAALAAYLSSFTTDPAEQTRLLDIALNKSYQTLVANTNDPTNRYDAGIIELLLGNYPTALEHLTVANRVATADLRPRTSFMLALALIQQGQPQQAIATLQAAGYDLTRSDLAANTELLADAAVRAGDADLALATYGGLLTQATADPSRPIYDWQLYDKYLGLVLATSRYQAGVAQLTLLLGNLRDPQAQAKLLNDSAGLKLLAGKGAEALADYDAALKAAPQASEKGSPIWAAQAEALLIAGQKDKAYLAAGSTLGSGTPGQTTNDGAVIQAMIKPDAALPLSNSPFSTALVQQAAGKSNEAATAYQQVLRGGDQQQAAAAYANLVALYLANKQPQAATALFGSGLYDVGKPLSGPLPFYPFVSAGDAFIAAGQVDRAEAAYQRAMEAVAQGATLSSTLNLSTSLNLDSETDLQRSYVQSHWADSLAQVGRSEQAVYHYRAAVAAWPLAYSTWYNLGQSYKQLGRNDLAAAAFLKAAAISPGYGPAVQQQAQAAYAQGSYLGGEAASSRAITARLGQPWAASSQPPDSSAAYRLAVGNGLSNDSRAGLNPAYIAFALMLLLMLVSSLKLFGEDSGGGFGGPVWLYATAVTGVIIFLLGPGPAGSTAPSLLGFLLSGGQAAGFFTLQQAAFPLLVYLLTALLTAALLYGVGGWLQRWMAQGLGMVAHHHFNLLELIIALATSVVGGFFFGSLQQLSLTDPQVDEDLQAQALPATTPSRRARAANQQSSLTQPQRRDEQRVSLLAESSRRLALPHLLGLGFGFAVAALFLGLYLTTQLNPFRLASIIAAAYLVSNVVAASGASGERVAAWNRWLWLLLALAAAALYGSLLLGLL